MKPLRTYIQQLSLIDNNYTKGDVVDLLETFKIGCENFPYKNYPEAKDLPTHDWPGEDGIDVFVPDTIPMKDYELEVTFIYSGTEQDMRTDIDNFVKFLYGRNSGAVGARLAIFDEHVGLGRKDVRVKKVGNDFFYDEDWDDDKLAGFKVTFHVDDPTTEVVPTYAVRDGERVAVDLTF